MATKQELQQQLDTVRESLLTIYRMTNADDYKLNIIHQEARKALGYCDSPEKIHENIVKSTAVYSLDSGIEFHITAFCRLTMKHKSEYYTYINNMTDQEFENLISEIKTKIKSKKDNE